MKIAAVIVLLAALWALMLRMPAQNGFAPSQGRSARAVMLITVQGDNAPLYDERRATLLFFGYTRCTDVCPRTLGLLTHAAWDAAIAPTPRVVFVDVDQRDTAAMLRAYAAQFPGILALRGTESSVSAAQRAVGAREVRAGTDPGRHDARVFVLDNSGVLVATLEPPASSVALAAGVRAALLRR